MANGNLIGISNLPTPRVASGMWSLRDQYNSKTDRSWPAMSPDIITNGLTVYLDAYNTQSYPGTGTTWFNLVSGGVNGTLNNGVTFSTSSGISKFVFDGSNDYISIPINLSTSSHSIMVVGRMIGTNNQRAISSDSGNWLMGWWGGNMDRYYAEGWIVQTNLSANTNWICYVATGNYSTDSWQLFKNGVSVTTANSNGTNGPNGIRLGGWSGGEYSACEMSFVAVYNRVLTDTEIYQNYQQIGYRYSI